MKEDKNIDRLFQERFKDFEAQPHEKVWKNLAQELQKKQAKKSRILPFWYQLGGVAAILAILLSGFYFTNVFKNPTQNAPKITFEIDQNELPKIEQFAPASGFKNAIQTLDGIIKNQQKNRSFQSNSQLTQSKTNSLNSNTAYAITDKNREAVTPNNTTENSATATNTHKKVDKDIPSEKDSENILEKIQQKQEEQFAENETEKSTKEIDKTHSEKGKISVTPFAAPVYYGNLGNGNPIDASLAANNTSSDVTLSYGLKVAYAVSEKIKIRSGINKVNLTFKTKDITYSYAVASQNIGSIDYTQSANNIKIRSNVSNGDLMNAPNPNSESYASLVNNPAENGTINQQFGYIEVPLEIAYQLANTKLGVTLIGGASSLFLQNNTVAIAAENGNVDLGKSNNLEKVSFTTNIGVGLDYQLTDQFKLNVEPTFKYQLNSFNAAQDVNPYFFGIYTGVSFEF